MTDAPPAASRATLVVTVLAMGGIVVSLMQTLIIPLLPELPALLHAPATDTSWAVTATLLSAAVATPVVGRLGDMYGKRRLLVVSLGMLSAGSVVGALSHSLVPLIIARGMQGTAQGVIPLGISIMRDVLPAEQLGAATALMSASLGVGSALGLPAAVLLAERLDWHLLFWAPAGLGVLLAMLVLTIVPATEHRSGGRFDLVGAAGLSAGLVCLLLAIAKGGPWGWTDVRTAGLFGAAAGALVLWGWWELRTRHPLVDLRITARRQVLLTNLASVAFGFAIFALFLVVPQLVQAPRSTGYGLGRTMLAAGLALAPAGLVMMVAAPLSARISTMRGPKATLVIGAAVVAAAYGAGLGLMSAIWQLVLVSCLVGAGIGLAYGALPALIMAGVPMHETAAANGLNTLMRAIGTAISSAVAGAVLTQVVVTRDGVTLPTLAAFRLVLMIAGGAALLTLAIGALLPRRAPAAAERADDAAGGRDLAGVGCAADPAR